MEQSKWLIELHYLPSVAWFSQLRQYEECWLEGMETYQKGSFRNRAHIAGANGRQTLSIPLEKGKNEGQLIREVRIAYRENWQHQHWHSILSAYGKSPFFEYYEQLFKAALFKRPEYLFDYNRQWLNTLLGILKWKIDYHITTTFERETAETICDARAQIHPKKPLPSDWNIVPYPQVFEDTQGFLRNLSILDLLCCMGPEAENYL